MSWDPGIRYYKIHIKKDKEKEVLNFINDFNRGLIDKFLINNYSNDEYNIYLEENGYTKYGGFSNGNQYNQNDFIKKILDYDNDGYVLEGNDSYLSSDDTRYYYNNGKLEYLAQKSYELSKMTKEEKIKKIKNDFDFFRQLSSEEQKDFDYQMASLEVEYGVEAIEFGSSDYDELYSDEFLDNEQVVRKIFKYGHRFELFNRRVPAKYKENDELMLELLKIRPGYIKALPFRFRDNKKLILDLLNTNIINNELPFENDDNIVIEDNCNNYDDFKLDLLSKRLRNDKKIVIEFIKKDSNNFKYASKRLRNDLAVVKLALKLNSLNYQYISEELQNNKELLLYAYANSKDNYCRILQYASGSLKKDYDVCYQALMHDDFDGIDNIEILNNPELIRRASENFYLINLFNRLSDNIKDNKEIIINYISYNMSVEFGKNKDRVKIINKLSNKSIEDVVIYGLKNDYYYNLSSLSINQMNNKKILSFIILESLMNKKEFFNKNSDWSILYIRKSTLNDSKIKSMLKKYKNYEVVENDFDKDKVYSKEEILTRLENNEDIYDLNFDRSLYQDFDVLKYLPWSHLDSKILESLKEKYMNDDNLDINRYINTNLSYYHSDEDIDQTYFNDNVAKKIFENKDVLYKNTTSNIITSLNLKYIKFLLISDEEKKQLYLETLKKIIMEDKKKIGNIYDQINKDYFGDINFVNNIIEIYKKSSIITYLSKELSFNRNLIQKIFNDKSNDEIIDILIKHNYCGNNPYYLEDLKYQKYINFYLHYSKEYVVDINQITKLEDVFINDFNHTGNINYLPISLKRNRDFMLRLIEDRNRKCISNYDSGIFNIYDDIILEYYSDDAEMVKLCTRQLDDEFKEEYSSLHDYNVKIYDKEIYDENNYDDSDVNVSDFMIDNINLLNE